MFKRFELCEGVFFNTITDKRFKANQITVHFYTDFDETSRADYSVASYVLTDSCEKYPHYKDLSKNLFNLYNASLSSNTIFSSWEQRCTYISASVLDNRYALDGENLEAEMCDIIRQCLLFPNVKNGAFDEQVVSLMKSELIDTIDSVINEKANYAARQANKTAYRGEPLELSALGTREQAEMVTAQSAYAAYRKILETSHIEIFAAGCSDFADAKRIFSEIFAEIPRHDICTLTTAVSPLKAQPEYVSDTINMQQAIIRMVFKAPEYEDRVARALLSTILGGMTTSRFFENIREKQSLCYYCASISNKYKRTLTAYAGVEPADIKRCEDAIIAELRDICENGVTEEELRTAKLETCDRLAAIADNASAMTSWYLSQITDEEIYTPEEYAKVIEAVTPERIQAAARMYTLDTVYTLSGEEADND